MKRFVQNVTDTLAEAALLEMGIDTSALNRCAGLYVRTLEESLIEVAFAEAADYDEIHGAIYLQGRDIVHFDDCLNGVKHQCYIQSDVV